MEPAKLARYEMGVCKNVLLEAASHVKQGNCIFITRAEKTCARETSGLCKNSEEVEGRAYTTGRDIRFASR
jgi:hypothetical protein